MPPTSSLALVMPLWTFLKTSMLIWTQSANKKLSLRRPRAHIKAQRRKGLTNLLESACTQLKILQVQGVTKKQYGTSEEKKDSER